MRDKILEYAKSQGHSIEEQGGDVYDISFNAKPDFLVTITVACSVHEWFISVNTRDDSKELFFDWSDHYGDKETKLDEEMKKAVINTIKALNNAHIRISQTFLFKLFKWKFFKSKTLEVKTGDSWVDFWELTFSTLK